jgi:uncharacterized protein YkwD
MARAERWGAGGSFVGVSLALGVAITAHAGCVTSGKIDRDAPTERARGASLVCTSPATSRARDVACSRWACAHASLTAAAWDGDAKRCAAGAIDADARERALALINAYRSLAGVRELVIDPRWEAPAQDCALLAHANHALSHEPPRSWACWSDRGARASAVSLVANRSAPLAIDPLIEDPGNERTMVHRRWLLGEKVHRIGLGSTSGFACALVDGREWDDDADAGVVLETRMAASPVTWVAWPPPGEIPVDAFERTQVDRAGWTVQSSTVDLDGARVEVRAGGAVRPVRVSALERTLGSLTALRFVPDGWSSEVGVRYDVHVEKEGVLVDYAVTPVACDGAK